MNIFSKTILLLLPLLFLPFIFVSVVFANEKAPERTTLQKNQTVDHDYFAANEAVDVNGTVNGDAYVAGGSINIDGTINGDVLAAGGQVNIAGTVRDDVRVAGGDVHIRGTVGKNVTAIGGNIYVDQSAKIAGNLVSAGGNIYVLSPVQNLTIAGGNVRIDSSVQGDAVAAVGNLDLAKNASISGSLRYWSDEAVHMTEGATVSGKVNHHRTEFGEGDKGASEAADAFFDGIGVFFKLISFIATLIAGIGLILLAPVFMRAVADTVTDTFWFSMLVGFITLLVTPVLVLILLLTLVGIPFGLLLLVGYITLLYFAKIFVAITIGEKALGFANQKVSMIMAFIIGLLIYSFVSIIPIIGGIMEFVVVLVGIGALFIQKKAYYTIFKEKKLI